jgi:hypothetical protein
MQAVIVRVTINAEESALNGLREKVVPAVSRWWRAPEVRSER